MEYNVQGVEHMDCRSLVQQNNIPSQSTETYSATADDAIVFWSSMDSVPISNPETFAILYTRIERDE